MEITNLEIRVDSRQAVQAKKALKDLGIESKVVEKKTDGLERSTRRASKSFGVFGKSIFTLKNLLGTFAVVSLGRTIDSFTKIETNLNNVTKTTRQFTEAYDGLFAVAQKNGAQFDGLVSTYTKLNVTLTDTVRNSTDLVKVTDLLSRGLAASGASTQTAQAALLQLSQGLATDFKAAGQELNSLIEGAPVLANAIAVELGGKSALHLKKFAEAGILTQESFIKALLAAEDTINAFAIPPTIGRSLTRLKNAFQDFVGTNTRESVADISKAIDFLAENFDTLGKFIALATSFMGFFIVISSVSKINAVTGAVGGLGKAFSVLLSPTGVIAGLAALTSTLYFFRKDIKVSADSVVTLDDLMRAAFEKIDDKIGNKVNPTLDAFKKKIEEITGTVEEGNIDFGKSEKAITDAFGFEKRSMLDKFISKILLMTEALDGVNERAREIADARVFSDLVFGDSTNQGLVSSGATFSSIFGSPVGPKIPEDAEDIKKRNAEISKFIKNLKLEGIALKQGEVAQNAYNRLKQIGLEDVENLTVAEKSRVKEVIKTATELFKARKAQESWNESLESAAGLVESILTPQEIYAKTTSEIESLQKSGAIAVAAMNEGLAEQEVVTRLLAKANEELNKEEIEKQKRAQELLDDLKFQIAQVQRSTKDQQVYNNLRNAQVDIESRLGMKIKESTEQLYEMTEAMEKQRQLASELQSSFESAFEEAIFGAKSFSDVLRGLVRDFERLLFKQALANSGFGNGNFFNNLAGGITGFFSGDSNILPGFANGGSFQVGGFGGIDNNVLSVNGVPRARVSNTETINVSNGSGSSASGGVTINMNIQTPDANSFRQSQGQILRDAQMAASTAMRRNG